MLVTPGSERVKITGRSGYPGLIEDDRTQW